MATQVWHRYPTFGGEASVCRFRAPR